MKFLVMSFLGMFMFKVVTIGVMLMKIPIFTLFERKILSYIQNRKGPKKVSVIGILQPIADGGKLLLKNLILPIYSKKLFFMLCPLGSFLMMCFCWFFLKMKTKSQFLLMKSILFFICLSSVNMFTLLGSGWSSNSKYATLGSLRGIIQVISYEIGLITLIFLPAMFCSSLKFFSFFKISKIFSILVFPVIVLFVMSLVCETNRAPFDFAEGESELVSGFNLEYGSFSFALLFLAEYGSMIFVSMVCALLFFKIFLFSNVLMGKLFCFFMMVFRGCFPRWRIDYLMNFGWKMVLPIGFMYLFMYFLF